VLLCASDDVQRLEKWAEVAPCHGLVPCYNLAYLTVYSAHSFTTLTATTVCLAVLKSSLGSQASGSVDRKPCSSFKAVNKLCDFLVTNCDRHSSLKHLTHLGSTRLRSLLHAGFDSAATIVFSCHERKPCWRTMRMPPSLHLSTTNGLSLCEVQLVQCDNQLHGMSSAAAAGSSHCMVHHMPLMLCTRP